MIGIGLLFGWLASSFVGVVIVVIAVCNIVNRLFEGSY